MACIETVMRIPTPTTKEQIREFLGEGQILLPLETLLRMPGLCIQPLWETMSPWNRLRNMIRLLRT